MGRSFTPREQYLADQYLIRETGCGLRGECFMTGTETGIEYRLDNHLAKDRYPELSFLFGGFDELFLEVKESENALNVLDEAETELRACEAGEVKEGTIYQWFMGKLDPCFYYNDENNRLFYEYLLQKVSSRQQKQEETII